MKIKLTLLWILLMSVCSIAQVIGGPTTITGNSLVSFAPWPQSGIIPTPTIRGWNGNTCSMLLTLLPWDVALGTKSVVLVLATNDVHDGVLPADHIACVDNTITWLLANRPGIKISIANTPPFAEDNCYGDYRAVISAYNALYAQLPSQYPVTLVDVWTGITDQNGWAYPQDMSGPCGIHFGQPQQNNPGWTFFMAQVKAGVTR